MEERINVSQDNICNMSAKGEATAPQLTKIIEEMQQHAKTCETVAQDATEEALTGASCDKDKNAQDAKEWMIKSKVWLEAEAVVRGFV